MAESQLPGRGREVESGGVQFIYAHIVAINGEGGIWGAGVRSGGGDPRSLRTTGESRPPRRQSGGSYAVEGLGEDAGVAGAAGEGNRAKTGSDVLRLEC